MLRQNPDADILGCNADGKGENDRCLTASDTKTRSLKSGTHCQIEFRLIHVTGLSIRSTDLASKRLELQREIVPRLRRVAIMANVGFPEAALEMRESQHTARKLGLEVAPHEIERAEDIAPAFDVLKTQADALYVVGDALLASTPRVSLDARLPTTFNGHFFVEAGGLMSYGPNYPVLFQRAAELVDHILRGTRPGDIPIEQPTKFELVVNLKTANALGLEIPLTIFASAGQVIE